MAFYKRKKLLPMHDVVPGADSYHKEPVSDEEYLECALDVTELAGEILLQSGAEIFRVEETMDYIARAYGITDANTFVLSSGIFMTSESNKSNIFARVKHIPISGARLDKVAAVNQLSREIVRGKVSPFEAEVRLQEIRSMKGAGEWMQILCSGIGSGAFCYLFGGDVADLCVAFVAGFFLYFYVLKILQGRMSKILTNSSGAAFVTLIAILAYRYGIGHHLGYMIIGSVIPLVPGVAFTNAVRDIMNQDYIAGSVRLLDTLVVTFSIAFGVGFMTMLFHM